MEQNYYLHEVNQDGAEYSSISNCQSLRLSHSRELYKHNGKWSIGRANIGRANDGRAKNGQVNDWWKSIWWESKWLGYLHMKNEQNLKEKMTEEQRVEEQMMEEQKQWKSKKWKLRWGKGKWWRLKTEYYRSNDEEEIKIFNVILFFIVVSALKRIITTVFWYRFRLKGFLVPFSRYSTSKFLGFFRVWPWPSTFRCHPKLHIHCNLIITW